MPYHYHQARNYFWKITHFLCTKRTALLLLFYIPTIVESPINLANIFGPDHPKCLQWDLLHLLLEANFHHSCLIKRYVCCQCSHCHQACWSGGNTPSWDHGFQGSAVHRARGFAHRTRSLCHHSIDVGSWKPNWPCNKKGSWDFHARLCSTQRQVSQQGI